MNLMVVIDDKFGLMFNKRRQSQDRLLREYIIENSKNQKLWMNEYSKGQFKEFDDIIVDNDFLEKCPENDFCFVENNLINQFENKIQKIYLFKWNREYPRDLVLDIDFKNWKMIKNEEFKGSSHDKISVEEWVKVDVDNS